MMSSFDEIETAINTVPITYLPALLITVVNRCVRDKVFVDGGMQTFVAKASIAASSDSGDSPEPCPEIRNLRRSGTARFAANDSVR